MAIGEDQLESTAAPHEAPRPRRLRHSAMELLRRGPLPRVLIAIIAGSSVSLVGVLVYLYRPENEEERIPRGATFSVSDALAALDAGGPLMAQRMATRLAESGSLDPEDVGGPPYIFGVVAANDAERLWGEDQKRYFRLAARYLEQSRDKGFPAGREAEGLLLLGKSLLMCGQVAESRAALEQALEANPKSGPELLRLLVLAYKSDPEPNSDRALLHSATYLEDAKLTRNERAEGLLHRAEVLFQLKQNEECRKVLSQIEAGTEAAVESLLVDGELLMREGAALLADDKTAPGQRLAAAKTKYQAAIDVLRRAQNRGTERERITRRSMYLIGRCLLQMEQLSAALDQFRRTRETYEDTHEGIAAALEEAEVAQRMGQDKDLAQRYIHLLRVAGASETYYNPLLPLDALRQRLAEAYQRFLDAGDFASAVQLAEALYPLFPRDNSITLVAQAHSSWAQTLEAQAAKSSGEPGNVLKNASREQRRRAAAAYAMLAQLRFATDLYTEDVWNSAENYLRGQDYPRAEAMLLEYLKYQLRRRRPRALLDLGDVQLALGKPTQALVTLQECIDTYTRDPASYRARLVAARAQMERGSLQEAKRLLLENLEGTELDPESVEWRDSLFSLGALLHDEGQMMEAQGRRQRTEALASNSAEKATAADADLQRAKELYEQAARRLEEAVARYPDVAQVVESRYVIAESLRALARFAREKLERAKIETTRLDHSRELHRLLQAAVVEYEQVQDILTRRRERSQLTPLEQAILRNCYFARGAAFYELGRFEDAIAAYAATTNRYHDEPEVLVAFLQLAQCYRQVGKPDEARGVIEQAKAVLQRMPEDTNFEGTTIHSRQEWARTLDWAAELSGPQETQANQP
jgi:tetratricopeptide (TPR) repeat protein